jgi:hypothetical protein
MFSLKTSSIGVVAVCVLFISGCGAGARVKTTNELKAIGLAYHNFNDSQNKGPARAEDLEPFLKDWPEAYQHVKDGTYVFFWNVSIPDMVKGGGSHQYVLAYPKDAPDKGGPVLFGDASVTQMTANEVKNAKKADTAKSKGGAP